MAITAKQMLPVRSQNQLSIRQQVTVHRCDVGRLGWETSGQPGMAARGHTGSCGPNDADQKPTTNLRPLLKLRITPGTTLVRRGKPAVTLLAIPFVPPQPGLARAPDTDLAGGLASAPWKLPKCLKNMKSA